MSETISKLLVVAGTGSYPRRIIAGARKAGVKTVDVLDVKGSCERATRQMADGVFPFAAGECDKAMVWAGTQGYDVAILAGQVSPMSLFRGVFDAVVRGWLKALPVKNAHTIFGKLIFEFERQGTRMLPASCYMDDCLPGVGCLTARDLTATELDDVRRGVQVAGTSSATFYAWAEVLLDQKRIWNGPVWSEGHAQFVYAGLSDGNYAQDGQMNLSERPWLPDFDLRKIHPLECDFGMGCLTMFAPPRTQLERQLYQPSASTPVALTNLVDRFVCATLAHGHIGYLILDYLWTPSKVFGPAYGAFGGTLDYSSSGLSIAMRSYFMTQQIAARYSQANVRGIRYFSADGVAHATSEALVAGVYERCQLAVAYDDGTVVVANGNTNETLDVTFAGERVRLPPCGYRAWTADGTVLVDASCGSDGVRADYCESPAYVYLDGRGRMATRAKARADGAAALRFTEDGYVVSAVPGVRWSFKCPARTARARGFDGQDLGPAEVVRSGEWFSVRPVRGALAYEVTK